MDNLEFSRWKKKTFEYMKQVLVSVKPLNFLHPFVVRGVDAAEVKKVSPPGGIVHFVKNFFAPEQNQVRIFRQDKVNLFLSVHIP